MNELYDSVSDFVEREKERQKYEDRIKKRNAVRTARELKEDGNKVRTVKMTNEYVIYGCRK